MKTVTNVVEHRRAEIIWKCSRRGDAEVMKHEECSEAELEPLCACCDIRLSAKYTRVHVQCTSIHLPIISAACYEPTRWLAAAAFSHLLRQLSVCRTARLSVSTHNTHLSLVNRQLAVYRARTVDIRTALYRVTPKHWTVLVLYRVSCAIRT